MNGANGNGNAPDKIGEAIAKVETPAEIPAKQWPVTISSTGRPAVVILPTDATDSEIAEVAGWLLTQVMAAYRAERAANAGPQLVIAHRLPT